MALSQLELEQWLTAINKMSPEQAQLGQRALEEYWFTRFDKARAAIQANLPPNLTEKEVMADIEGAIREAYCCKPQKMSSNPKKPNKV